MKEPSSSPLSYIIPESAKEIIKSLGVVFGDIGTSPIYTLSAIFEFIPLTLHNVLGVVSLIIWTLISVVCVQYAWLAMSLSKKGEGGTIVLREILRSLLSSKHKIAVVTFLSILGISLFIGDGVITPAISILSAVEGVLLIPGFEGTTVPVIIFIACCIAIALFLFQKGGTERVSMAFGPVMAFWFLILFISGICAVWYYPQILRAFNPYYGIRCVIDNGWRGMFILSGVILCATGGEALYADMGHLGRKPIQQAWIFVFISLVACYAGQGAYLLAHPEAKLIFFDMIFSQIPSLYVPFLCLTILATVIASQAMISGVFSVVYQGITTRLMPMLRIEYTSARMHAQVYIGVINWLLMGAVLLAIISFKRSSNLAYAYGLAVSADMVITSILMTWIFALRKKWVKQSLAALLILLTTLFFFSSLTKLWQGAYWSLIVALVPLSIIIVYYFGSRRMRGAVRFVPVDEFIPTYTRIRNETNALDGTALYFVRRLDAVPAYVAQTMFENGIMYDDNVLVSITQKDNPYGITGVFKEDFAPGLRAFEIRAGYMEVLNIERILQHAQIEPKVMFYGLDSIVTKNPVWRIYAIIKRLAPTFVQFHKLPIHKLHGVVMTTCM